MDLDIKENISLKDFTTFSIGGKARFYICVKNKEQLKDAFRFVLKNKLRFFVLGNGSNILFDDKGFDGVVIHNKIDFCDFSKFFDRNKITVGAGCTFLNLSKLLVEKKLSGLEFFSAIPASIGGSIYMNAGGDGVSISSLLQNVSFMFFDGREVVYKKKDLEFSYRYSSFQKMKGAIIHASFLLSFSEKVKEKQKKYLAKRNENQPIRCRSAGCVFKNPKRYYAKELIEQCGLKGMKIGGAKI